jgi:hypothetical protein
MNEVHPKLKRIIPVHTDRNKKTKNIILSRWQADKFGRFFSSDLSAEKLKPILLRERVKLQNLFLKEEDEYLVYKYKDRPMLTLNRNDGQFYSPYLEIEQYGLESVQNQAHIIMEMLKKAAQTAAKIERINTNSSAKALLNQLKTYNCKEG